MKLIDIEDEGLWESLSDGRRSAKQVVKLFMKQPIIVAIPIEYLCKELKQCKASTVVEVGAIIDKWVKENETN